MEAHNGGLQWRPTLSYYFVALSEGDKTETVSMQTSG